MRVWQTITLLIFSFFCSFSSFSQGCSDAGFCTIGSHSGNFTLSDSSDFPKNQITLNTAIGMGDFQTNIITPSLEYAYRINSRLSLQSRVTYNIASGKLGSVADFGDVYLVGTYVFTQQKTKLIGNLGIKIPLNEGNLSNDEVSTALPMTYQSSLGTYDLLAGLSMNYQRWLFSLGLQLPLTENNENNFTPSLNTNVEATDFPNTNQFRRSADILLRVQRQWNSSNKKWMFNAGLLGLYHLGEDKFLDLNEEEISIANSAGLTLNITLGADYKISDTMTLGVSWGNPVAVREERPDGLTRSFVITPSFRWNF